MPWTDQPIFFVDFEGSVASGILEYGVVTVRDGAVLEARTRLCAATGGVRAADSRVHGLTAEGLSGRAPFSAEWEMFAGLRERGPFAAHYSGFENALIRSVWPYPRSSPHFGKPGERIADWGPWIDSARLYGQLFPGLGSGGLEATIASCGLQAELDRLATTHCPPERAHYHAALYDALAGALLLSSLARHTQIASLSTAQILALSTLDPDKRENLAQRELF